MFWNSGSYNWKYVEFIVFLRYDWVYFWMGPAHICSKSPYFQPNPVCTVETWLKYDLWISIDISCEAVNCETILARQMQFFCRLHKSGCFGNSSLHDRLWWIYCSQILPWTLAWKQIIRLVLRRQASKYVT